MNLYKFESFELHMDQWRWDKFARKLMKEQTCICMPGWFSGGVKKLLTLLTLTAEAAACFCRLALVMAKELLKAVQSCQAGGKKKQYMYMRTYVCATTYILLAPVGKAQLGPYFFAQKLQSLSAKNSAQRRLPLKTILCPTNMELDCCPVFWVLFLVPCLFGRV